MKTTRFYIYMILAMIALLSVYCLMKYQKTVVKSDHIEDTSINVETNSKQLIKQSNGLSPFGTIISDNITSSNRIVVAEKNGVQKTAQIPLTLANSLTDDQILGSLFYTNTMPKDTGAGLNQYLSFYGLTVDDKTNVLAGVDIVGSVLVVDGQNAPREVIMKTESDGEGRFQFNMDYGQLIVITVNKGTNFISPPSQSFRYGVGGYGANDSPQITNPNALDPVTFVLTKKIKPEELVELRKGLAAPNTGEPVRIDLTTGEIVPTGGDLIVSITCLEPYKAGVHIPWKLMLQATDGGFVMVKATRLGDMLGAPEYGYDKIIIEHTKDDINWSPQFNGIMYLMSRNGGIYGKMTFDMQTRWDERGVLFGFHSFVNTNGSRNLQMSTPW